LFSILRSQKKFSLGEEVSFSKLVDDKTTAIIAAGPGGFGDHCSVEYTGSVWMFPLETPSAKLYTKDSISCEYQVNTAVTTHFL
jgi:hypothetical protein